MSSPASAHWLTIIGIGEDGPNGLPPASLKALQEAKVIMGSPRHLSLLPDVSARLEEWPVPFADGIEILKSFSGQRTVALASGDPFWYGAGSVFARHFASYEWRALPVPSTFSRAAAQMGWPLETTACIGLHAAPITRLKPHLAAGQRVIVLLRDGDAVAQLQNYLAGEGFAKTALTVMEALGGPRQRVTQLTVSDPAQSFQHPVCAALEIAGDGAALTCASGRADEMFDHDGQITKRPMRALTMSALAPRPFETLWDLGAGSGSISIEWLLSHPTTQAVAVEANPQRATRAAQNAQRLGVDRLRVHTASSIDALDALPAPDAVFIGGGLSQDLLEALWAIIPKGCRIVANAVTLEAEALLAQWHRTEGGDLLRIELAQSKPLGSKRGWSSSYPIVQWGVTR
ncbi:precorrin-6y C5,15-methyltransferase (decarboxylating) subunit CbiE [Ascidiaceihabitans sp.]|uniref:precorrin-6y C5,15-methyltransferase (decarboxylating) subunit CbiE n=1 Tax=Ascidiaceihabitans sp. TaxID=1872644 RepID=UPI00329A508A